MSRAAIAWLAGIVGLALYLFAVLELAELATGHHWAIDLVYFAIAGIAWAFPAARLMRWVVAGRPAG
ncbi:DUF2842 domain-containing protein [Elioraea sp.]|uniref:DUF2842 domain-containing protein n=1 Tax=Elioraea sp. TaxID=2185103 RepID=UPI0025C09B0D|nr:DUF2842 domain-containing protein [Elioraea sp.]